MKTPIVDFVREYSKNNSARLHMPGHKGACVLGCESADITEIIGADSLYDACGIIAESEKNASIVFDCPTFYSTEGSTQCIKAMLYLVCLEAAKKGEKPLVAAPRNAHKAFICAAALLDFDILWIECGESYLAASIDAEWLDIWLNGLERKPTALYITSPDYLGNIADIEKLSKICHKNGALLCVDNAHGAYLHFLERSQHPIALGADICCDSAHKTLPVLTGGAYLHISSNAPKDFTENAKSALALFGSTSPSYLIMQSLDAANRYLCEDFRKELWLTVERVEKLKKELAECGYTLAGDEPVKLTVLAKKYGYTGIALANILQRENIFCEFADEDYLVIMISPKNTEAELDGFKKVLLALPKKAEITDTPPALPKAEHVMSIREAVLSPKERISAKDALFRTLASFSVSCPPAVSVLMCGEKIDEDAVKCFEYYGIDKIDVVR
ncbi:MAG: aminotransferase class V-fold PLP-dependent enzyme [Clostridia bacterium]|nr:aminotransferase class V-fold PLP-dependent enzyme [Clostridia bacterium]